MNHAMPKEDRESLRHFLSAAIIFDSKKTDVRTRTLAAFDEWFALDALSRSVQPTVCDGLNRQARNPVDLPSTPPKVENTQVFQAGSCMAQGQSPASQLEQLRQSLLSAWRTGVDDLDTLCMHSVLDFFGVKSLSELDKLPTIAQPVQRATSDTEQLCATAISEAQAICAYESAGGTLWNHLSEGDRDSWRAIANAVVHGQPKNHLGAA